MLYCFDLSKFSHHNFAHSKCVHTWFHTQISAIALLRSCSFSAEWVSMADVDPRQLSTVSHSFTLLDCPTAIWLFPDIISESHPDCGVCEEIAFGRVSGICFDMFWHVTWNRGVSLFPGCPCVNPPSPSLSSQATPFKHCEATSRSETLHFMMIKVLGANCLLSNTFQTGFKPSRRALLKYKSRNREQAGQRWDCPLATRGWCTDARKYRNFWMRPLLHADFVRRSWAWERRFNPPIRF